MADITLRTANKVDVVGAPIEQHTAPCNVNIVAGQAVSINPSNGRWILAVDARAYGVATKTAVAGAACTAVRQGVLDGFVLDALNYDANVYANHANGNLADAASATTIVMGRVIPGFANFLTVAHDKLLLCEARRA